MPSIIDQLIVELQLDPRKFKEGQKEAEEGFRRFGQDTERGVRRMGEDTERGVRKARTETSKLEQSLSVLQGRLLGIAGLFLGGMGIKAFTEHITKLTAATGYMATNLGVSTKELGAWQGIAGSVGASAGEITQGFASIRRNMADFQLHGESPLNRFSAATHQSGNGPAVGLYEKNGEWRDPTAILLDMSRWAKAQKSPAIASQGLATAGMSEGMVNLLMLGPQELEKRLKEYEKFAPSKEETRQFQELQEAMAKTAASAEKLARGIVLIFSPGLIKFMESITRIIEAFQNKGVIGGLKTLDEESSKGVGEAYNAAKEADRKVGEETTKGGIWGRVKSWWTGKPVEEVKPNPNFEWHNPLSRPQAEAARREQERNTTAATAGMSGDGPSGAEPVRERPAPSTVPGAAQDAARVPSPPIVPDYEFPREEPRAGAPAAPARTPESSPGQPTGQQAEPTQSSDFLRQRRQRYADEIARTPGLRDRVGGMLALEGTAQPTMESLLNRIDYVNTERAKRGQPEKSIDDMLNSGFYGPINRGQLPSGMNTYRRNPQKFDRAIDRSLGGSHVIGGYTDQGLPTDPNGSVRNAQRGLSFPYKKIGGNEFTDWAGGPGRAAATSYRKMIEDGLEREKRAREAGPQSPLTTQPRQAPSNDTFRNWNNLDVGARGALTNPVSSSVTNSRTHTTNIENMNVAPPPGASPAEYGGGIRQELNRYDNVMNANQGLL